MRLLTMLLSLVVMTAVAVNVSAQDTKKKGNRHRLSFADMDTNKDGKLTKDEFVTAHMKNVPEDRKEKAQARFDKMWDRLSKDAKDKTAITEDEYKAAMEKMRQERADKSGKKQADKSDKSGDK